MDEMLCDELLEEIFTRLPSSPPSQSSLSVPLVSKRWLTLYRASRTSLSLRLGPLEDFDSSSVPSLSSLLGRYPSLSSLSLLLSSFDKTLTPTVSTNSSYSSVNEKILFSVAFSCPNLKDFRVLIGPVSRSSLFSLSRSCAALTSLTLSVSRPVSFKWIAWFSNLKDLSIYICSKNGVDDDRVDSDWLSESSSRDDFDPDSYSDAELGLESLSLSGIREDDLGIGWLWRSCKRLKKLKLKSCGSLGDGAAFSSCLNYLEEVELRTCRSVVDCVLLKLAVNSSCLISLLVYDGGSSEGLLHFIANCRCDLQNLDLRLPLDLNDDHLYRLSVRFRCLSHLRLQSCCLVTGEGLKTLSLALSSSLVNLALINCDAVEREPGLLATLGQNLKRLRKLELSYNEFLSDKEFISMLVSCNSLIELKLRGCKALTGASMVSMIKSCKEIRNVDLCGCCAIDSGAIELFVLNSRRLRQIQVEESKLSEAARTWVSNKFIEVVV